MTERRVTVTDDDVEFLRLAREHYAMFAEAAEKQGESQVAGAMRRQEFYAERLLLRADPRAPHRKRRHEHSGK